MEKKLNVQTRGLLHPEEQRNKTLISYFINI